MRKVAFFDIDGTLFRSSLLIEVVEACVAADVFPSSIRDIYAEAENAWIKRSGSYETYVSALVRAFRTHIRGVSYGTFADIGSRVVEREGHKVYRYTRDLIADLRSKDYFIVAISHSPKCILDVFCAGYGFHKVYGYVYEIGPRDCFTGDVVDEEFMSDKAQVVARVFEKEGCTYEGSIGVGDTEGDIPMLTSVEMPICFNPNQKLYTYATEHSWPVVVERKDVVYTL